MRKWKEENPHWGLANAAHHKSKYQLNKQKVYDLLGNCCVVCGFNDPRALQIDHIHGDGNKSRFGNRGYGYTFFLEILKDPDAKDKYQILCANHNWIKRHENKEFAYYPKQKEN